MTTAGLPVGTYSVTATCGERRQVADVALVYVTANSTAPTAQALVVAVVLAFFLLLDSSSGAPADPAGGPDINRSGWECAC